ncbi:MAG: AAA family ATPase [Hominilimicola sp.]
MNKKIITISREFGSGGRYIGEKLAEKLGFKFCDKEIIAKIAEETGLAEEFIKKTAEYAPKKNIFAYAFSGRTIEGESVEDYLNSVQRKIILEFAEKKPCVIVGRGADYILRDREDCVNIFIHGNMPQKIKRIVDIYNVSEAEAKKLIKETDKKRSINYNYYTSQKWGDVKNYTMTLNSSEIGIDRCVEIISQL